MSPSFSLSSFLISLLPTLSLAQSVAEINGNRFISSYRNQAVTNVTGLVTATGPNGFWLRSTEPDDDPLTSESIYIFTSGNRGTTTGDIISLNGRVSEYRSNPDHLFLTEIINPTSVNVLSSDNDVVPLVIGENTPFPPSQQYTSLDSGDVFSLPNSQSRVSAANPVLSPNQYGFDFWESLSGELVNVSAPIAISKPTNFGETWVRGRAWPTTNHNGRGGLTMTAADANPEAIIIGRPLDGSKNPDDTKLGDELADIIGVLTYAFGFYRVLPLTAITITNPKTPPPSPASLISSNTCSDIVIGSYNVENLWPSASNLPLIAEHIVKYLHSPPLVFLQEIQDNNGKTNDAVVSATLTLSRLASAITGLGGRAYMFSDINPADDQDGGEPGGNIRVAYLYDPAIFELVNANPGSSADAVEVVAGTNGPELNFNPGRIKPGNNAWDDSRKPLVAQWRFVSTRGFQASATETAEERRLRSTFFTVNVHFTSKGGSSSLHGDQRTPVNGGVRKRLAQTALVAEFVDHILAIDSQARIIAAGDWNEFSFVEPLRQFVRDSGLQEADVTASVSKNERYTYLFDMNSQQLDHVFISDAVVNATGRGGGRMGVEIEHVHVNTWVSRGEEASDHDPSLVGVNLC